MDLLAHKIDLKKGKIFMNFLGEIEMVITRAYDTGMPVSVDQLEKAKVRQRETALNLGLTASSADVIGNFFLCYPFSGSNGRCYHGVDGVLAGGGC